MGSKNIFVDEEELLACCRSTRFAEEVVKFSPFISLEEAITVARDIWFNKVDVQGWLQAFTAHPQIGQTASPSSSPSSFSAQLSCSSHFSMFCDTRCLISSFN